MSDVGAGLPRTCLSLSSYVQTLVTNARNSSHPLPNLTSRLWVVIPAAGSGMRMGAAVPKQYLPLAGRTVIEHSMARLAALPGVAGLVVALAADDPYWPTLKLQLGVPVQRITGGSERCHSVLAALTWLLGVADANDWVLVHDAARPCVRRADLQRLLDTLADDPIGGLLAIPARDTKKRADANGRVLNTVDRTDLWKAQTPQMFRLGALHEALSRAIAAGDACDRRSLGDGKSGADAATGGRPQRQYQDHTPGGSGAGGVLYQAAGLVNL